jgi:hypothetical protein
MKSPKPRDLRLLAWWAGSHAPIDLPELADTLKAAQEHCRMKPERFEALCSEFAPWLTVYVTERLERRRKGLPASPRPQPPWLAAHRRSMAVRRAKAKKASPWFTDWMFKRLVKSREIEDSGLRVAILNGMMARIISRALPYAFDECPHMRSWLAFDRNQLGLKEKRRLLREAGDETHCRAA